MSKKTLTGEQKKLEQDIWVIAIVTAGIFLIYTLFAKEMIAYIKDQSQFVLWRLLLSAGVQFGVAGLGIMIVCILRKEHFSQFGLIKRGSFKAIIGSVMVFLPYIAYIFASGQYEGYHPLSILLTEDVKQSGFPLNLLGMIIIALVWGFFEGFNYAVISDKFNQRYKSDKVWWNSGALVCTVICVLLHPISTTFWGTIELVTTIIAIYGMLVIKERTNNAWGCIAVFCLIWNAF